MTLAEIYHYLLRRSPSPERAKIEISEARRDGRLPLFCAERRERKAQPGIRLRAGERPPEREPIVEKNYALPQGPLKHWDLERSYATSRDWQTHSHYEYVEIYANDDDVFRIWPRQPADSVVTNTVRAVALLVDAIEREREHGLAGLRQEGEEGLLQLVNDRADYPVSLRTLQSAMAYRRRRQ
jgi:hypothetical protein